MNKDLQISNTSKVYITGSVASGKSTLAKELRKTLSIPSYELDLIVHPTSEIRNNTLKQKKIISEIDTQNRWIFEGTNRNTYDYLFDMADLIVLLEPPLFIRTIRILTRYIKQKLKIEQTSYNPNFKMLTNMYKWLIGYQKTRKKIITGLNKKYSNKLYIIKNKHDKEKLLTSIQNIKYFSAEQVLGIYNLLKYFKINIWIDGGWGIDSLLQKETRFHSDLDIVIEVSNLKQSMKILETIGYILLETDDYREWNFVLSNGNKKIDFHVIKFDKNGHGIYGPEENNEYYPNYAFGAVGRINNQDVNCISIQYQVESHSGYTLRDKDIMDMYNLSKMYKLQINKEFKDKYEEIFVV